jgi:hypothetical protein
MRWQFPGVGSRIRVDIFRPIASISWSLCLVPFLSGCILGSEKPELAVDIPAAYLAGGRAPDAALPSVTWWRGFRSPELSALIEQAQRRSQCQRDAVARLAGDFDERHNQQLGTFRAHYLQRIALCELRDRLLGQERRHAARRRADRRGEPLRS